MDERKPKAREDYREFASNFYNEQFSRLGPLELGLGLTRYYVERIHNRSAPVIDADDLDTALIDGSNDLGADLIHRDDGRVYIYQSKYKKSVTREEVETFQRVLERLRSKNFKKNKQLLDQLGDIDWDTDTFILKFICLGKIENAALQQTDLPVVYPPEPADLPERVTIEYLDEARLDEELRTAQSSTAGIPGEITLVAHGKRNSRSQIIELPFTEFPSVVLVVSAKEIVAMYRRAKNTLFTLNIRNYIGSTATNSNIIKTALEQPKSLYYFNNGISCLARSLEVSHSEGSVTTTGIQVINGAQTVRALHRAAGQGTLSDEAFVLVRITEVSQGYGGENKFGTEITKYNNTQNVIKISDFRSNDPVQHDLTRRFSEMKRKAGAKRVVYAPKRSDERRAQTIIIRLEDFAKVCYAYLCDPVKFSGSTSFLFEAAEGGGYCQVFGDGKKVWQIMPEDEFKLRSAVWWMAAAFAERLKADKKGSTDKVLIASLERKWFLICTARLILEAAFGVNDAKLRMARHWVGDWELGEGRVGKLFEELYDASKLAVHYAYKQAAGEPTFSHRNWMRNERSVKAIADFVASVPYYDKMLEGF